MSEPPPQGEPATRTEKRGRNPLTILLLLGVGATVLFLIGSPGEGDSELSWKEFEGYLDRGPGAIEELTLFRGDWEFRGKWSAKLAKEKGEGFVVKVPNHETYITPEFERARIWPNVAKYRTRDPSRFWEYLLPIIPWIILIGLFWFIFLRQLRSSGGPSGVLSFGKSRAKLHTKEHVNVTFEDVAGIEEAKEEVQEIVAFLKNPGRFQRLGGRVPKGVLLVGSPGTGKTLLAKAIAGEADVPFFAISGSDFVEMFVGVGASRVRDLFKQARENSPCIIFLDEIDAVGRKRGAGLGGGHDEREQTLNAILVEMDGFDTDEGIIILAATNRPDILDAALLRPGRFDRQIVVDMPDVKGREGILRVHARGIKIGPDVDLKVLARGTPTFSGADLEAVMNEAAIIATMKDKDYVEMSDLEEARDKVKWGRQKRSRVMEAEDRRITAFHEAGHALVAHHLPKAEPLHKVTIIPRGMALGATMQLPERDRYHMQRKRLLAMIQVLFAGRLAEEMFCDDISSGAQNDIERATELARRMVTEWGMSERIGPINYREGEEHLFLGKEVARSKTHGEQVALEIDEEVKKIILECYEATRAVLEEHRSEVEAIAAALLKYEVLSGEEVAVILRGDSVEAYRRRKAAAAGEAKPPPEAATRESEDDVDDLEAKGHFAY
jgi:cell division protease FtsH